MEEKKTISNNKPFSSVFVGTYSEGDQNSIYHYHLDAETGELKFINASKGGPRTSYLILDSQKVHLFAVNEEIQHDKGTVTSFNVHPAEGSLTFLNQQPSIGFPCHLTLDPNEGNLLVANYASGTINVFPVTK